MNSIEETRQRINMELWGKAQGNELDIQKKQVYSDISLSQVKEHADIMAAKEFQKTFFSITSQGEVILQKERFGENIKGKLPIKILAVKLYAHLSDMEGTVLCIVLMSESGKECCLFWDLKNLTPRAVRMPFEKNGIDFGFGEKKETEVRHKFISMATQIADTVLLPEEHSWYQIGKKWDYAFPKTLTWQEVNNLVRIS